MDQNTSQAVAALTSADHVTGTIGASLLVVAYGDYQCPFCKAADRAVRYLLSRYSDHMSVAYRHFPLVDVHPYALGAALASEAAAEQGSFWEMHGLMYRRQPRLSGPELRAYAMSLGLDMGRYDAAMENPLLLERVLDDVASGLQSGVRSTPAFFVNGRLLDVSYGVEALVRTVQGALPTR